MHEIVQPSAWPRPKGYAAGVKASGTQVYVSGQIGWNEEFQFETNDFVEQMEQALRNVVAVVEAAGGTAEHLATQTWYVTDKREYLARQKEVGQAYRRVLGRHFTAMAVVVVAGLMEDEARIEIEAVAVIPD